MVSLSDSQLGCEEHAAPCSHCEAVNAICAVWLSEQLELKHRAICSSSWQQAWRVAAHFCWEEASHWHQWKVRKVLFSHLYNKFFWIFFWHRLHASEIFFFFWSVVSLWEEGNGNVAALTIFFHFLRSFGGDPSEWHNCFALSLLWSSCNASLIEPKATRSNFPWNQLLEVF